VKHSEQINEIAAALAKAQAELKPAIKDSVNPAFRSRYADLAAVWEAWHAVGPKYGLATVQDVTNEERGIAVATRLLHASGQWLEFGPLVVPLAKIDAHGVGSATSYAKRYSLSAAVGVVAEDDDDANAAVGRPTGRVDRSDDAMAQRRTDSVARAPYDHSAKGVPLVPPPATPVPAPVLEGKKPTAAEAGTNGWAKVQTRKLTWSQECQAALPPDEALFLMPEDEAEQNRGLYVNGIREIGEKRLAKPSDRAAVKMQFLGSPTANLDTANIYLLRAMWLHLQAIEAKAQQAEKALA
jgi:hypothetical protein